MLSRKPSRLEEYGRVWHHHKTLVKGILEHHDTRPGGGWGPAGQEYNTGGIWNDVLPIASDFLTVDALHLTPGPAQGDTLSAGSDASLRADVTVSNQRSLWPGGSCFRLSPILRSFRVVNSSC